MGTKLFLAVHAAHACGPAAVRYFRLLFLTVVEHLVDVPDGAFIGVAGSVRLSRAGSVIIGRIFPRSLRTYPRY